MFKNLFVGDYIVVEGSSRKKWENILQAFISFNRSIVKNEQGYIVDVVENK